MAKDDKCPNCTKEHTGFADVCMLSAAFGVIVYERESLTFEEAQAKLPTVSADAFWDALAEVIDRLEEGEFDYTEDEEDGKG